MDKTLKWILGISALAGIGMVLYGTLLISTFEMPIQDITPYLPEIDVVGNIVKNCKSYIGQTGADKYTIEVCKNYGVDIVG